MRLKQQGGYNKASPSLVLYQNSVMLRPKETSALDWRLYSARLSVLGLALDDLSVLLCFDDSSLLSKALHFSFMGELKKYRGYAFHVLRVYVSACCIFGSALPFVGKVKSYV